MNLGGYELQIFVTVMVILGCAFVALLVDYLKGSNEKLRESHVDLLARQETLTMQASQDTNLILQTLTEQTASLRKMADRPIAVTALPPSVRATRGGFIEPAKAQAPITLADIPVKEIPTPRRVVQSQEVAEWDKVKVSLIAETQVAAAQEPAAQEPAPQIPAVAIPEVIASNVPDAALVMSGELTSEVAEQRPEVTTVRFPVEAKALVEEVLPPNVVRIRLVPDLRKQNAANAVPEPVMFHEPTAVAEPVSSKAPSVTEDIAPEGIELEDIALEDIALEDIALEDIVIGETEPVAPAAAAPEVTEELDSYPPIPDFDRFLEELVTEFESLTPVGPEAPARHEMRAPEPVQSLSCEPVIPSLDFALESPLETTAYHSNVEEFTPNLEVPLGTQPVAVLDALFARKELLTGLVVSIGINEFHQIHENLGRAAAEELLRTADGLMASIGGEEAFCTRRSPDEFVLIYPRMSGPSAQRRLSELSERLWDFQLRSLGTFSVVFSWGASEAQREPLSEAVATATERMKETQASRKSSSTDRSRRRRATA